MGRPKGSRNKTHKRKYTRRAVQYSVLQRPNGEADMADVEAALRLAEEIKDRVLEEKPPVARLVVKMVLGDMQRFSKLIDTEHPAP